MTLPALPLPVLRHLAVTESPVDRDVRKVMGLVAALMEIREPDLRLRCRLPAIVGRRYLAMVLCWKITGASLPQIARAFGGYHHTVVLYALRKVARVSKQEAALADWLSKAEDLIRAELSREANREIWSVRSTSTTTPRVRIDPSAGERACPMCRLYGRACRQHGLMLEDPRPFLRLP